MTTLKTPPIHRTDPHRGFRDFIETRPDEEKWELIEGQIVMQARPSLIHQVVVVNFQRLLNAALERSGSSWIAIHDPAIDLRPFLTGHTYVPDVAVIDAATIEPDQNVVEGCYLAAEILSPSDHRKLPGTHRTKIDVKRAGYEALPLCQAVLLIEQRSCALSLSVRSGETWTRTRLTGDDRLALPVFGLECAVADLYARTPVGRASGPG
ncbi:MULTISPECIES: Uma2 family endonuclease [unclassified Methylobacterium]|jgi:Uma2 family endonuclease|uniref:Uma2 family endonuclease n=1 Tax=unclassified Methylobacterium TaxID=2615210 RepID=UPI00034C09F9|nr:MULTISPECIES: Uma2 family endonuclease [unclassified Methylobacterium]SFD60193.1 Putative restriction endonuclease [Methylobacterium sp. 13MFTsu3.1M2]